MHCGMDITVSVWGNEHRDAFGGESGHFICWLGSSNGITHGMHGWTAFGLLGRRKEPWAERQETKFLALGSSNSWDFYFSSVKWE